MKRFTFVASLALLVAAATAQQPMDLSIVGTAANHQISWTTTLNYNYQVEVSPDLQTWVDTGIAEPGTGSTITYGLMSNAPKLFYRIQETEDPYNGAFLILPYQDQEVDLIDGVCIAFNLNVFAQLPAKIRIYEREYDNPTDKWEQIGAITEFADIDDIKFVRGSAVWLPEVEGEYEVQAAVIDGTGRVIASAVRRVIVGANTPPTIVITDGPDSPSASPQPAEFTTTVTDPDGDEIRRVEFFDNGVLIGTDREAPFGDFIEDLEGNKPIDYYSYDLLKGTHEITAKAYDARGAVGETASPFVVEITGGNSRPTVALTSPPNGSIVLQGQSFTIVYAEGDPDGASDVSSVKAYDIVTDEEVSDSAAPFDDLTIDTTGWEPGTHTLRVLTRDSSDDISYPLYLTIFIRSGSGPTFAETLVAKIVDETTAAPSAETFTGVEASSGVFSSGSDSGLELDSGALLTTGSFAIWNGGDPDTYAGENMDEYWDTNFGINNDELGDPELEDRVSGKATHDAAILEFDVYCSNGQLELEYQFGSEEYDEWVGGYNDGFMVTVDGVLVSLVPDCSDIVAVNSVHPKIGTLAAINEHLYLDDDTDIDPSVTQENQPIQVEYDGMTIRLRAHAFVTPNTTHRIKLVIADVDDDARDSGLFIGESSVRTINPQP